MASTGVLIDAPNADPRHHQREEHDQERIPHRVFDDFLNHGPYVRLSSLTTLITMILSGWKA